MPQRKLELARRKLVRVSHSMVLMDQAVSSDAKEAPIGVLEAMTLRTASVQPPTNLRRFSVAFPGSSDGLGSAWSTVEHGGTVQMPAGGD
jgi:hypothetical protein